MSWSYSQALVAEYLEACCSDIEPSALLNTTPMPDQYYWPDKPTEHSRISRFGMTCEPLTEILGKELLTWFLAGFRVRTLAQLGGGPESQESAADSGKKWHGLLAKFDPATCSWKTAQCSLLEDSEPSLQTFTRWGSMRNGGLYLRQIPALRTEGKESGFWQTPVADDCCNRANGKWNSRGEPKLSDQVMWTTPSASDAHRGGTITEKMTGTSLAQQVNTPSRWPTPCASMSKGSSPASLTRKSGKDRSSDRLDHAVMASNGGQLNPDWTEWLMGWPIGHTDLKPLATGRFQEFVQQHGGF